MKLTGFLFAAVLLTSCAQPAAEDNYTRLVDPKIGTGGHGHVFVGANVPVRDGAGGPDEHSADVGLDVGLP